jgi:hypothetical protein
MSTVRANKWQSVATGQTYHTTLQVVQGIDTSYRSISASGGNQYLWVQATINRLSTTSALHCKFSGTFSGNSQQDHDVRWYSSIDSYFGGVGNNSTVTGSFNTLGTDGHFANYGSGGSGWVLKPVAGTYLYQPSTTATTITIGVYVYTDATWTIYLNRDGWGGGGGQSHNPPAVLIVSEIDQ